MEHAVTRRPGRSLPRGAAHTVTFGVFALSLFLSAFLLFLIQPLFSKTILPLLGGAPVVWNTAMVFYQAVLLGGYLYAHQLGSRFSVRQQTYIHAGITVIAISFLPISVAEGWFEPNIEQPFFWLFGLLALSVGLPFFALSANAPLLQRWFSRSGHPNAKDPYFLYAISNAGSLLGLLSYPFVFEPNLRLAEQSLLWSTGYVILFSIILLSGLAAGRRPKRPGDTPQNSVSKESAPAPLVWMQRFRWIALAAVPSGLMLSVTTFITTDIVSIPLLWIIPLSLYLVTFIFTFAKRPPVKHIWVLYLTPVILGAAALTSFWTFPGAQIPFMIFVLAAYFIIAMACHGELAKARPDEYYLTEFYVWMSLGGVLGGLFTALIAPIAFNAVLEYPILIIAAAFLRPSYAVNLIRLQKLIRRYIIPLSLIVIALALAGLNQETPLANAANYTLLGLFFIPIITILGRKKLSMILLCFALTFVSYFVVRQNQDQQLISQARSFFGVYKINMKEHSDSVSIILAHGTTVHGVQLTAEGRETEPSAYYYKKSGIGRAFTILNNSRTPPAHVGIVGLGTGGLACYRNAGQNMTFFEIDPLVVKIAQDQRYFHFLENCAPGADIIVGDARLMLKKEKEHAFDMLVLDAFSSDSIPLHLLTREALSLYLEKLDESGLLFVHISNRFFNLEPVLAAAAQQLGLESRIFNFDPDYKDGPHFMVPSTWVVIARNQSDLDDLLLGEDGGNWRELVGNPDIKAWTDDFSNIHQILK